MVYWMGMGIFCDSLHETFTKLLSLHSNLLFPELTIDSNKTKELSTRDGQTDAVNCCLGGNN